MENFLRENAELLVLEAEERQMAAAEDDYSQAISDATFLERVEKEKAEYKSVADDGYAAAKVVMRDFNSTWDAEASSNDELECEFYRLLNANEMDAKGTAILEQFQADAEALVASSEHPKSEFTYSFNYNSYKQAQNDAKAAEI